MLVMVFVTVLEVPTNDSVKKLMLTSSSIVKVVREASIVIEAIVRELGGGQGSSTQREKQNSLRKCYEWNS